MILTLNTTNKRLQKLPLVLSKGLIVQIWMYDSKKNLYYYETDAVLVEKIKNWREPLPYPYLEFKGEKVINAVKELWKVKIVHSTVFDNGRELIRFIPRFHSVGYLQFAETNYDYTKDITLELDDENLIE